MSSASTYDLGLALNWSYVLVLYSSRDAAYGHRHLSVDRHHFRFCVRGTGTPRTELFHGTPAKGSSIGAHPNEQVVRSLATTEVLRSQDT